MNIKNALLICGRNFVLIWKQMVYTIILGIVVGLCLWGTLTPIFEMLEAEGWFSSLVGYFESIYKSPETFASGFELLLSDLWRLFVVNMPSLWGSYIVSILLILLVSNVAFYLSYFTAGDLVNAKLCSSVNYGWIHRFLSSLKRSVPYALLETAIRLPFLALQVGAFMLYGVLANSWIKATLLLPLLIILLLAIASIRFTLTMWFLPATVSTNEKLSKCLTKNFSMAVKNFGKFSLSTFVLFLVEFACVMIITVFTIGAGLILLIPAIPVVNVAYSLISYYQVNSMRYYIDSNTIVSPVQD